MLIRTRIFISLVIAVVVLCVIIFLVGFNVIDIYNASENRTNTIELLRDINDLDALSNDYFLNHKFEARDLWQKKYQSTLKLLPMIEIYDNQNLEFWNGVSSDVNNIDEVFNALSTSFESGFSSTTNTAIFSNLYFADQFNIYSEKISIKVFYLLDTVGGRVKELTARAFILGLCLVIFLLLIIIFLAWSLFFRLIRPLEKLRRVTQELTVGNYNRRLDLDKNNNELGQFVRSFNSLVDELNRQKMGIEKKNVELQSAGGALEEQSDALLNVLEDVEEEKSKAESLAAELRKFQLAVSEASDHIIITDPDGKIIFANKAAEIITGYAMREMLGKTPALWGGQMSKDFYQKMWHTIKEEKKRFDGEINNRRRDGENYIAEVHITPILDDNKNIMFFVGIERDITKEKEIDRAKTEFVSLASHQLRTPLTAISWYSEILMGKGVEKLSPDQRQSLEKIYQSNRRMTNLVNSLLNVSRIELGTFSVEPSNINLVNIAESILGELLPAVKEKRIVVDKNYDKKIPKIMKMDEQLLRIIIQNLLTNAVKYTPEDGIIKFSLKKNVKDIKIVVEDNGYGIPRRQQSQIFTKLFRADNIKVKDTDGTGLGLYMVKSILDSVGGKIWFESEENKGSKFYVSLPIKGMKAKEGTRRLETGEKIS